jgi:isoquinoline 1-oxidoreductase subunit beta
VVELSRREFMTSSAASTVALLIPIHVVAATAAPVAVANAYLRIAADGTIVATLPTSEMGQGTHTGQAMILAEELGVALSAVRIVMPLQPADSYRVAFGAARRMRSVGSFGIRFWHDPLRLAAAQARAVLTQAAAAQVGVPADVLTTRDGFVVESSTGRKIPFAQLVEAAARLPLPPSAPLLPVSARTLTGRATRRIDTPNKVDGSAVFGTDVRQPRQLYGAVRLAPVWRAEASSINSDRTKKMPGVVAVVSVPRGAVVVADTWWRAQAAAAAVDVQFAKTPYDDWSTGKLQEQLRAGIAAPDALLVQLRGEPDRTLTTPANIVEATYQVPFLAHACMEPIVCTAQARRDRVDIWMPVQDQDIAAETAAGAAGVPLERVFVHTTYLGGGFGRKAYSDIVTQAVLASRGAGGRPVQVMWARADDIQQGYYRPAMMSRVRAALGPDGTIAALDMRLAGPQMGREFAHVRPNIRNNLDPFTVGSLVNHKYTIAHQRITHNVVDVPVPLSPWRAVSSTQNGFFLESFVDELAHAAKRDPLAFRRAHLQGQPRHLAVLDRVASMSVWDAPRTAGTAKGLAIYESYGSVVAQVVEVKQIEGMSRVMRVWVAIGCGRAINPGQVVAQMEGSVIDALGAAWKQRITVRNGRAEQSNFSDMPLLRINEVPPRIEVAIVEDDGPLGGVGEPGVPPLAPAVANALFAATGKRMRALPFGTELA